MINRRKFLEAGAAVGVGAMIPVKVAKAAEKMARTGRAMAPAGGGSPTLTKFIDACPRPLDPSFIYTPSARLGSVSYYEIPITAFKRQLHSELPDTYLWGYGGTFPSRTIEADVGDKVRIRWRNDLLPSNPHPVASAIDYKNIRGMLDMAGNPWPDQRIVTHLHGAHIPWTSDGGPKAWYTGPFFGKNGKTVIYDGYNNGDTYDYPNNQYASTLWYHDHAMGITRLNVYAGLAGFWILRDKGEANVSKGRPDTIGLPFGNYEIPLVFQDRTFINDGTGRLFYPAPPEVPEFFGDTMLVNGKVWPFLEVEPRKYRFRMLNGCNARFLRMQLVVSDKQGTIPITTRQWTNLPFVQIGAEGGFFNNATPEFNTLLTAPAERADVIIDFAKAPKFATPDADGYVSYILLYNDAATPFGNTQDTRGAIPQVMLFKVKPKVSDYAHNDEPSTYTLPGHFTQFVDNNTALTKPSDQWGYQRQFKALDEITLPNGMLQQMINLQGYETDAAGNPVPPDVATLGTTEVWEIINTTVDVHPIHLHQTMFQVISRQPFSVAQYQAKRGNGPGIDPIPYLKQDQISLADPNELGWKDTVRANPGEVVRIAMKWVDYGGNYVYHCHILEHEEHDMMRALTIQPVPKA